MRLFTDSNCYINKTILTKHIKGYAIALVIAHEEGDEKVMHRSPSKLINVHQLNKKQLVDSFAQLTEVTGSNRTHERVRGQTSHIDNHEEFA